MCLRDELIDLVHSGLKGSHVGVAKTLRQLAQRAWWRGFKGDVQRRLRRCFRCSRYYRSALPRQGPLH